MSELNKLKAAKNLSDVAQLLGFSPKGLAYVLYKQKPEQKYKHFEIPKKTGGTRSICAPTSQLALLQERLGEHLYQSVLELKKKEPYLWAASHGFHKGRTIVSNAQVHRRRRFVFNVDIEDFFGAINFGRVRGYFIKDRAFELDPKVATIIAQIACHENALPQGSPCSPIISNLIGNILDLRLIALAKNAKCTYTRYADDLTFSTNLKRFPSKIAISVEQGKWVAGDRLVTEIGRAGFNLNSVKTRMSHRQSRQTVTGLIVNKKVNIRQEYYRTVRVMCNSVFQTGVYYRPIKDEETEPIFLNNLNPLEGMLSHIYFVKARRDRQPGVNKLAKFANELVVPEAPTQLYRKFLCYKHFVALASPLIVTEGVSDITYLKCAIKSLSNQFPNLVENNNGMRQVAIKFLKPTGISRDILNLAHGATGQASLISNYANQLKKYTHKPIDHPVIILCDNDDGPKTVFKNARSKTGKDVSKTTIDSFYHLVENLYLVKVPEGDPPGIRELEDLFPNEWFDVKINGKPFNRKKDHGDTTAYGKVIFAESVVRPNTHKIDFAGFVPLLSRIEGCIAHYKSRKLAEMTTTAASGL
ncbi:retron Ec67 family RNA-directed DNA polymerase/endonuclease [Denitrobaculum tricleocarpae]|uniref:RNA-directed DNA polymerase n=1 Tax=Denitrobaculum tricleocarpae TaxID=2591009 RepID=A0A545T826_9PROT|nr:retron Ec67 family RNA-directed DNA polymerase/endonuclease [Denitrobaculum tricleocarpae]TQV73370.1 RNA-directed DNA polymerase [Denitrobaculum tricleocarpae]